jgi:Cdc6-like AAA superfamily ATPase
LSRLHFDNIKSIVLNNVTLYEEYDDSNFFIIRDVFGRISVYIEDPNNRNEIPEKMFDVFVDLLGEPWLNTIETVEKDSSLLSRIKESTTSVLSFKNVFYGERHLTRLNWFRKKPKLLNEKNNKPKIITFYSFKGGVGRTTSMVMTALQLTRQGKKVVLIDFDLEAPGLSTLLVPEQLPDYGVVDYLLERQIYSNTSVKLDIDEYIYSFQDKQLVGSNGGQLYVLPASNLNFESTDAYLEKMGRLDFGTPNYAHDVNPISDMLNQISDRFDPDFILLDARTGIHDVGGLTLTQFTDIAFLLFYGNEQNAAGMRLVLPKVIEANIPFFLINSPVPLSEEESKEEKEFYLENSYNILVECGYYSEGVLPDLYEESAEHFPYSINYNPMAALINSSSKIERMLEDNGRLNVYLKLAEQIASFSFEEKISDIPFKDESKSNILESISEIMSGNTAASENEFKNDEDLINKFYPLKEHRFIFETDKILILGPKGSGKTALFSVLEHSKYAKELASYLGLSDESIKGTHWITGLKQSREFPSSENFLAVGKEGNISTYKRYWKLLAIRSMIRQLNIEILPLPGDLDNKLELISTIRELSEDINLSEKIEEYLEMLDDMLAQKKEKIIIVYDALDVLLKKEYRGEMISALIGLWYEYLPRFKNIRVKIFLRDDIFNNEVNITDKVKLRNYSETLDWTYDELLAMVWKRMAQKSEGLAKIFTESLRSLGLLLRHEEKLGYIPKADEEVNKAFLKVLIGERMGTGKAAFSYNWIRNHLADTNDKIVPRSILKLFASSSRKELDSLFHYSANSLIRPKSLHSVMPDVSIDRVYDLLDEYEEYKQIFTNLKDYLQKFPANEDDLKTALRKCGVPEGKENSTIDDLVDIGVMKPYQRKKSDPIRYHIPDIFLIGLGLSRVGLRAIK